MTGKIFRSCFLVGLAMMVLCTALFFAKTSATTLVFTIPGHHTVWKQTV